MVVALALVALAVAVGVVPRVAGGQALTVLTGSMQPAIRPGDMVVVVPVEPATLEVGDVVTFQPHSGDPTLVTHRIVRVGLGSQTKWTTRGDANGADDEPIIAAQIKGKVVARIPVVGVVVSRIPHATPVVAGVGLLAGGLWVALSGPRPRRRVRGRAGRSGAGPRRAL